MPGNSKVVEVPGVGNVEFPADMDDKAIGSAIQTNMLKTGAGMEHPTAPYPPVNPMRSAAEPADPGKLPPLMAEPLPLPFSAGKAGVIPAMKAVGRSVVGSALGSMGGGYLGKEFGPTGETIGKTIGGLGGAVLGGQDQLPGMPKMLRSPLNVEPESTPINKGPNWREMKQFYKPPKIGVPGSTAQETGYYPPVTKVPIRSTPDYKLTPESVPGPDTAGKGNLLSPLAKKGDPRAAQELMRRGRNVLYVPADEYPGPRETWKPQKEN